MASVLREMDKIGVSYTAYSLSQLINTDYPNNVFNETDGKFFRSKNDPGQWWQVSFKVNVLIESYIIKNQEGKTYPVSWDINISDDNKTWKTVQTKNNFSTDTNTEPIKLDSPVSCKHFRIAMKNNGNSNGNNFMIFSFFDCFGSVSRVKYKRFFSRLRRNDLFDFIFVILSYVAISKE